MITPRALELANIYISSMHNCSVVKTATECACFFCLRTMKPEDIKTFTDSGKTVICCYCGIDSVLPNNAFPNKTIDEAILREMHERYFMDGVV
jgi:hypothetical protein